MDKPGKKIKGTRKISVEERNIIETGVTAWATTTFF